ncbi:hypothetical protein J2W55_004055 [Mucilaginibacter pocheonensis]|uniref:Uncharacterized protein n=1 Tax=Mucilaginibacter pocheonensis TaxID=398050 RepID=A0ABU1TG73_9SPHI|nr:hypothetical protein [Mucilaginibacter pocheonensis]
MPQGGFFDKDTTGQRSFYESSGSHTNRSNFKPSIPNKKTSNTSFKTEALEILAIYEIA